MNKPDPKRDCCSAKLAELLNECVSVFLAWDIYWHYKVSFYIRGTVMFMFMFGNIF